MKTKYVQILLGALTFSACILMATLAGATNYSLTLYTQGGGVVSKNPTNSFYPSGATVTITAAPSNGWYFANWSGDTNSTVNPLNVPIYSNMVVTGNFLAYPTYSIAVITNGQGGIALSPSQGSYQSNTMVTATATAAEGWVFVGWSGIANGSINPISFPADANGTLTGIFAQLPAFDMEPVSVTNQLNSTVSFSSHSVGTAPLVYTWYFSGGSLNNAAGATLTLTNVTSGQAGNYYVVAMNNYGSVTSLVVSLTLTNSIGPTNVVNSPNPERLQSAIALGGWVGIKFSGTVTLTNTIDITNNVVLDATGVAATISGGHAVQLFHVAQGAGLTISNLTLADGACVVTGAVTGITADGGAIYNDGTLTMVGCVITNSVAQSLGVGGAGRGGAIFNNGGTVLLWQSMLISNTASGGGSPNSAGAQGTTGQGLGGAIYNTNGTLVLSDCNVTGNSSTSVCQYYGYGLAMGGAVFQSAGTTTISNSSFEFNQTIGGSGYELPYTTPLAANPASAAYGGAVAGIGGSFSISESRFLTNQVIGGSQIFDGSSGTAGGGAIYCTSGWSISDSTFCGNQALAGNHNWGLNGQNGCGGGIFNAGTLTINQSSLYLNSAEGGSSGQYGNIVGGYGLGGGIYNSGQLAATNCTIALNSTVGGQAYMHVGTSATTGDAIGGGLYNSTASIMWAMNLTIASNSCSAPAGDVSSPGIAAGLQVGNGNTNGTFHLHNCIIAYGGTNGNAYGPITDGGYNISSDGSAAFSGGSSYNYTDPQLGSLGNYGGPTLCMALLPASPAIDNADPSDFPSTDQRGYVRPFGSGPDVGSFEYGAVLSTVPTVSLSLSGNNAVLSFAAFPPSTYYLQYSTNLTTWLNISANGPITVSTNISQTVSRQGINHCFYRLLVQ